MIQTGKAYAWQDKASGKWCLSKFPKGASHANGKERPVNRYDTQAELVKNAAGIQLVWDAGTN